MKERNLIVERYHPNVYFSFFLVYNSQLINVILRCVMEKMLIYIQYLIGLFESLYDNAVSVSSDLDFESVYNYIYKYFNDYTTDLNEFNNDYYNCYEYGNLDKKLCLYNLMYAVYILMNEYYKISIPDYMEYLNASNLKRNVILLDIFSDLQLCYDIIDTFIMYLDRSEARRKKIALSLMKNKNYINICSKNKYNYALFFNDISVNISEEAYLVDDVVEICNNFDTLFDLSFSKSTDDIKEQIISNIDDFDRVKKILSLNALVRDINTKNNNYYIKHYFSIMLKNLYCDISFSKIFKSKSLSNADIEFYKLINDNVVSFDELFESFVKNKLFSAYLVGNFYFNNIDKDMATFEHDDILIEQYNLKEKIKKYYI